MNVTKKLKIRRNLIFLTLVANFLLIVWLFFSPVNFPLNAFSIIMLIIPFVTLIALSVETIILLTKENYGVYLHNEIVKRIRKEIRKRKISTCELNDYIDVQIIYEPTNNFIMIKNFRQAELLFTIKGDNETFIYWKSTKRDYIIVTYFFCIVDYIGETLEKITGQHLFKTEKNEDFTITNEPFSSDPYMP